MIHVQCTTVHASAKECTVLLWNAISIYVQTDENFLAISITYILELTSSLCWYLVLPPIALQTSIYKHWTRDFKSERVSEFIYRVSQEEWTKLRESVPYVELYRYNPKHLYLNLNGYGDNGHRKVWASGVSTYCMPSVTPYSSTAHARQPDTAS